MKQFRIISVLFVLVLGFAALAHAGLDDFLRRVDREAREDISRFNRKISEQFGVPVPKVEDVLKQVPSPADAFMIFQLGNMSGQQPETVLHTYRASRDKGWGSIAKELGIKPGSPEFHALKRGDLHFAGAPAADPGKGKSQGKGKKHKKD